MEAVNKNACCKCHGLGSKTNIGGMLDYGKGMGATTTCEICNGSGVTNNLFAVEFQFTQKSKLFWLPMLILADNSDKAMAIAYQLKREISSYYHTVSNTIPIRILTKVVKGHFQTKFSSIRKHKFALFSPDSNSIKEPEGKPSIRFNKHLKFKPTNTTLLPSTINNAANKNMYPIRVIKGNKSFDPVEYLITICKEQWSIKGMLNKNRI